MYDLISRQEAIEAIDYCNEWNVLGITVVDKDDVMRQINVLPTIEERKKGKWLFPYGDKKYKRCSVCERDYYSIPHNSNFCPNCGADMRQSGGEGHE